MKFYFYKNSTNFKEYAIRLVEDRLSTYMVDSPDDADFILVSLCDITEINDIEQARKYGKPVLTGGMISEYPIINELSDYTYHGEVYGLGDHLDAGGNIDDCQYITTRDKRNLAIYQRIDWAYNPIIGVGGRAKYYYVSKGCPIKCKYCYMANVRDYQVIPQTLYNRALRVAGKNLMPIAAYNPYGVPARANIGETLLKKYISDNSGRSARMIRSGVEFVTPELSRGLAKSVVIDDVNAALEKSKREGTKLILYFIAGLESQDAINDYFSRLMVDYATTPTVNIVFTYIDPQPFTPFHDFDISRKIEIDAKEVYRIVSQINKRVRVMPLSDMARSTHRTILARLESKSEYDEWRNYRKFSHDQLMDVYQGNNRIIGTSTVDEILLRERKRIIPDYWN